MLEPRPSSALSPGREAFVRAFADYAPQIPKLERYAELLTEWNQKFNLVGKSTLADIWGRHFLDSAQLMRQLPSPSASVADVGSGAGFPGLVLSLLGARQVQLIESIGKKATFLEAAIQDLGVDAQVHRARCEDLTSVQVDVVTARAVGSLTDLFKIVRPLLHPKSVCLFLKGARLHDELTESSQWWRFDPEIVPSISDPSGSVLIVHNLRPKNGASSRIHRRRR